MDIVEKSNSIFNVLGNIRNRLANNLVMCHVYNYDKKQTLKAVNDIIEDTKYQVSQLDFELDIRLLTKEQMLALDFGQWDEGKDLMLIPLWLVEFVKNVEVYSISDEACMLYEIDKDIRYGCVAYGVVPRSDNA